MTSAPDLGNIPSKAAAVEWHEITTPSRQRALPDEKEPNYDRDRQEHIENGAGHIDPEIADRLR
jgi:hypothetical protein